MSKISGKSTQNVLVDQSVLPDIFPHVLVVSNYWDALEKEKILSFAGMFVENQIASLRRAGVRVSIFDIGFSHSPINLLLKWWELRKEVKKHHPVLVHGQFGTIIGALSVFAGRPAVISFCGPDLLDGAPVSLARRWVGHLLSNIAALRASAIICKSEELRQALWWRKKRAFIIPNGVDLSLFSPGSQIDARQKLGWNHECPIIVIVVRNGPEYKGLKLANDSLGVVLRHCPTVKLEIIRNIPHSRMPILFRAADVLLCTSKSEGSPNVIKEAMACNLPIVSVPVGDVAERLAGVYPSALVSRDPEMLGEALSNVILERKRSNGREKVENLSLEKVALRVLDVYRFVLGEKGQ